MNVADLKKWLSNKKEDAKVDVVAHNKSYDFSLCLGGGCDGSDDYTEVSFYVDELCQNERLKEDSK